MPGDEASADPLRADVTIIGGGSQTVPLVGFFVGGRKAVAVFTDAAETERLLAPYPLVTVVRVPEGFAERPPQLPPPPYVLALDRAELIDRVRGWLPPTAALFRAGRPRRRRRRGGDGLLNLLPGPEVQRAEVVERFATLRRVDRLTELARGAQKPLILMYADPDPDAIGAALGLDLLWSRAGARPRIRYGGQVQRYQNKLLLQYLKADIQRLEPEELAEADLIAVVDAQPGFWREAPPKAQVVIDHHPRREDTEAPYTDLRSGLGSTSTILTEYLAAAELRIPRKIATALLFGLTTDTDDLRRNCTAADIRAFELLHARADHHFLDRLKKSQVPMPVLGFLAWGIAHRVVVRDLMAIHFGVVPTADVLVQAADLMLLTCGITWVVCAGIVHERRDGEPPAAKLVVVCRGDGHNQDVGRRAKHAFAKIGSAGGHRTMGRAEIPLPAATPVADTAALLVDNLFARMSPRRRSRLEKLFRQHLDAPPPPDPDEFELET